MKKVLFIAIGLLLAVSSCSPRSPAITPTPTDATTSSSIEVWNTYCNANFVSSLAAESGHLWVGTQAGVLMIAPSDQTYMQYTSANSGVAYNYVRCVAVDKAGNKWFGTLGGGVSNYDGTA